MRFFAERTSKWHSETGMLSSCLFLWSWMSRVQQSNDHRLNNGENDHLWNGSYEMRVNQNLINSWSMLTSKEKLGVDWAVAWRPRGTSPGMPKVGQWSALFSSVWTKIGGWRRQRWINFFTSLGSPDKTFLHLTFPRSFSIHNACS